MKSDKVVALRQAREPSMGGELEEAIRSAMIDEYNKAGMLTGSPLEWYGNRIGIGWRTLERRLTGEKQWTHEELIRINRDLKNARVQQLLKQRFDF